MANYQEIKKKRKIETTNKEQKSQWFMDFGMNACK